MPAACNYVIGLSHSFPTLPPTEDGELCDYMNKKTRSCEFIAPDALHGSAYLNRELSQLAFKAMLNK